MPGLVGADEVCWGCGSGVPGRLLGFVVLRWLVRRVRVPGHVLGFVALP
ncbi:MULTISPECIES: hypothetical protein [Actinomycetes]|nr:MULTISPECIES: hypothetical protein [Actinomycetes]